MGDYLALSWGTDAANSRVRSIIAAASTARYNVLRSTTTHWLGVRAPRPPRLIQLTDRLSLLGDAFEGSGAGGPPPSRGASDLEWATWLSTTYWGRYVALFQDRLGRVRRLFRDPSGAFEGLSWTSDGVHIVSSSTPDWLMRVAPGNISIDWTRVSTLASDPLAALDSPALSGLRAAGAGDLIDLDTSAGSYAIWRPESFARRPVQDADEARRGLREKLDRCLAAWTGLELPLAAEVSGGLDSAIVAGGLVEANAPVALWHNTYADLPETDERQFTHALESKLGIAITSVERAPGALTAESLWETAGGPRPGLNGRDAAFDILVAAQCASVGATALMTGKGGDALFFHSHTLAAFHDLKRARPWSAWTSSYLFDVARWTRSSIWSVLAEANRLEAGGARSGAHGHHPWMEGLDGLGAGKMQQIAALTAGLAFNTPCRRTEVVDLIHPLLSQPLMEFCLGIPTPLLTQGGRDRALARATFKDRLPSAIVHRRVKGDYTAWFNQEAANSLGFLRAHLLEGRLADQGVIIPSALEPCLDRDYLQWRGGSGLLVNLAMVESWVRRWESRRPGV